MLDANPGTNGLVQPKRDPVRDHHFRQFDSVDHSLASPSQIRGRLRWPRQLILHLGRVQIQIAQWVLGPETRHEAGQKVFVLQGDWKVSR